MKEIITRKEIFNRFKNTLSRGNRIDWKKLTSMKKGRIN